jgi:hypothetical protein
MQPLGWHGDVRARVHAEPPRIRLSRGLPRTLMVQPGEAWLAMRLAARASVRIFGRPRSHLREVRPNLWPSAIASPLMTSDDL